MDGASNQHSGARGDSQQPDRFTADDQHVIEALARWLGMVAWRTELSEQVAQEAAVQARRLAVEELISILAHALRTPLTALGGYLQLVGREARQRGAERETLYLERAEEALARLKGHGFGAIAVKK